MSDRNDGGQSWFYVREGRRQGPLDRRGLLEALLLLDAPEKVFVWRSGLKAWATAGALDELRDELPPPVPRAVSLGDPDPAPAEPPPPLPTENGLGGEQEAPPAGGRAKREDGDLPLEGQASSLAGTDEAGRRRRHRKRRARERTLRPYALRLVAILLLLAVILWLLLRRMDEFPAGTIIFKESTDVQGETGGGPGRGSASLSFAYRVR